MNFMITYRIKNFSEVKIAKFRRLGLVRFGRPRSVPPKVQTEIAPLFAGVLNWCNK